MNYGKVEERSSSRSRSPNTVRRAATSAILTDILSRWDRAPTSRTADARPGKSILIVPGRIVAHSERAQDTALWESTLAVTGALGNITLAPMHAPVGRALRSTPGPGGPSGEDAAPAA